MIQEGIKFGKEHILGTCIREYKSQINIDFRWCFIQQLCVTAIGGGKSSLHVYILRNTVFLFGTVAYSFLTDCILKDLDIYRFYEYSESHQNQFCPLPYVSISICHLRAGWFKFCMVAFAFWEKKHFLYWWGGYAGAFAALLETLPCEWVLEGVWGWSRLLWDRASAFLSFLGLAFRTLRQQGRHWWHFLLVSHQGTWQAGRS